MLKRNSVVGLVPALCFAGLTPFLVSCDDDEVAAGAAVIAVGAAAVGVGAALDDDDYDNCYRNRRRVCEVRYDYWGNAHRDCYSVRCNYNRPNWRYYSGYGDWADYYDTNPVRPTRELPVEAIINADEWAVTFNMSKASAQRVINAIKVAKHGRVEGLLGLGFDRSDVNRLGQLKYPDDDSVGRIARNLNQYPRDTKAMLSRIIAHGYVTKRELESRGRVFD